MDDKKYIELKTMLDKTVSECRTLTNKALEAAEKCEKLAKLCTKIAEDLARRGDDK